MRWFDHVRRMPERRISEKVYHSDASTIAGRGRPPEMWERMTEQS